MLGLTYFGVYRNHNYTEAAYKNQGRMYIDQGKMASNLDVFEQQEKHEDQREGVL